LKDSLNLARLARKDHRAHKALSGHKGLLVPLAHKAYKGPPERKVM
jgi:hypothetical protein